MIVISDTSPISNLLRIEQLHLLKALYGKLFIPEGVYQEISRLEAFGIETSWLLKTDWIVVQAVQNQLLVTELKDELDLGEAEAIALSIEVGGDRLLMDERLGRQVAQRFGLKVTGLLGVLVAAKQSDLITELKPLLDALVSQAKFRVHPDLYRQILQDVGEA
ncbi:DUF3368 domain-containing protein [Nodosilinea sp. FACHB-131]|uniref:DUF3368 domain-containing protein n=1 Tax=Cyanophyceae TaxID=3028117 RepID=UPI0016820514|nr:DUF3368 domain-containing protein [Nodosilinea sp. FACHB-131]MBD1872095.1 DUF3368 domain-containing protein [Nodosilinea sp. FACHB-131]